MWVWVKKICVLKSGPSRLEHPHLGRMICGLHLAYGEYVHLVLRFVFLRRRESFLGEREREREREREELDTDGR